MEKVFSVTAGPVPRVAAGLPFQGYRPQAGYPPAVASGSALWPTRGWQVRGETGGAGRALGRGRQEGM